MSESAVTIEELEQRLKDLELRFLGPESTVPSTGSNPFSPSSQVRKRIDKFRTMPPPPSKEEGEEEDEKGKERE